MIDNIIMFTCGAFAIRSLIPIKTQDLSEHLKLIFSIEKMLVGVIAIASSLMFIINMIALVVVDDHGFFPRSGIYTSIIIHVIELLVGCLLCYEVIDNFIKVSIKEFERINKDMLEVKVPLGIILIIFSVFDLLFSSF